MSDLAAVPPSPAEDAPSPAPVTMELQELGAYAAAGLAALAALAPLAIGVAWWDAGASGWLLAAAAVLFAGIVPRLSGGLGALVAATATAALAAALLLAVHHDGVGGRIGLGFYLAFAATWAASWMLVQRLTDLSGGSDWRGRVIDAAIPFVFGAFLFLAWEAICVGFGVPMVLLPAPSQIVTRFFASLPILGDDFVQTVVRAVIPGWAIGSTAGFLVAILADRHPFLGRGLMPLGNFVSALPMVGIAPIMVMWFGFDWQSKAAVVVINTFFPMLVNTVAGLSASGRMERDLMRSWNASWARTLISLRLPAAMPHIFAALKLNSTFALIGAIVAEFFGTPIVGMGFRISTEVGRMGLDMVWAEIVMAAITGSALYAILAFVERRVTFWHPSNRGR
ncbi:MAG: ABC transporter permease [Hyphomicrobiales bacterium]|nr:ABC transporter permease [Hyphomicrobiales bacterium]